MILAGDIGGTKTVLAVYRRDGSGLRPVRDAVYRSADYSRFETLLTDFWAKGKGERIDRLCIGVAGPIKNGECRTTNLPWTLSERRLSNAFGVRRVKLLNDLQAMAYGTLFMPKSAFAEIHRGGKRQKGNIAVIAAGTGLGEGFLYWDGKEYHPAASEGGHADFAPQNEREVELLRFLQSKFGHVSFERVLSGPGIHHIYTFLRESGFAEEPAWLRDALKAGDPSAAITEFGLSGKHPLCVETLNLFCSIYAAEAANLALKVFAVGGVFIGGGIAPKILAKLKEASFMRTFVSKGRYADLLDDIPVKVVLDPRSALVGAAHWAMRI